MKEAFPRKFTLFYSLHHGAAYGVILGFLSPINNIKHGKANQTQQHGPKVRSGTIDGMRTTPFRFDLTHFCGASHFWS